MGCQQRAEQPGHRRSSVARALNAASAAVRLRLCRFEAMEERHFLAGDVHLGAVYFEDATGDDSQGDTIQVTFEGGEPGTELTRVVIDGDKDGLGPSAGDVFFDTAPGGAGAFGSSPLTILASDGFQVLNSTVSDGGSRITFDLAGFKAGMKLVFTVDADEIQFVDPATGAIDVNAIVEGGEFQRSHLDGTFTAPHFQNIAAHALFWDAYDDEFAVEAAKTGATLKLPPDRYSTDGDFVDRTAGAVASVQQVPLPITLAGTVYRDDNRTNTQQPGEPGLAGVSLSLFVWDGSSYVATGRSTVTDATGAYHFEGLLPGKYRIVETQPSGYFSVGATPGNVDGEIRGVVTSPDVLSEITLLGGDDSVRNDFAESPPGSLSGYVHADVDGDCVFDPDEIGIAGVVIQLLDINGVVLQVTSTDAGGRYRFDNLVPGEYQIRELQPTAYFDSGDHPGSEGGVVLENDLISQINLQPGRDGMEYHFCEIPPAMLCGYVYHDANNNGVRDAGEQGIGGVSVALNDATGTYTGRTEFTDAAGKYCFDNLRPGTYSVREVQPANWLDGLDAAGTAGGTAMNPGDLIVGAVLKPLQHAEEYNFGELLPASIRGHVHADTNGDCTFDPGEQPIANVVIQLFDANGALVATTTTNALGEYLFSGLKPGNYTVHEVQPADYLDGGQDAGSAGGVESDDTISQIPLGSGVSAFDYNFCEIPPAMLCGYVYFDRHNDGLREPGKPGIAGVELLLTDADGNPTGRSTLTDASGFYCFDDLPPGSYGVCEVQPNGYQDGLDTPGTAGGVAINPGDCLLQIALPPGEHATEYNFGELRDDPPPPPPEIIINPPPTPEPKTFPVNITPTPGAPPPAPPIAPPLEVPKFLYGSSGVNYTWHLSVIDAGHPRGDLVNEAVIRQTAFPPSSSPLPVAGEASGELSRTGSGVRGNSLAADLKKSKWTMAKRTADGKVQPARMAVFGLIDGTPITGDFNGDGMTDIGFFKEGEWFIDLNGNGEWDEADLWARLGTRSDKPVTGDWNGDGKTDIGIYGPAWPRDPHAIKQEPGIPDPANTTRDALKNHPPQPQDAALGSRELKLTTAGKSREDLIDHVFHYGAPEDVPITGDWNGDGIDTIGVFKAGQWYRDLDGDGRTSPSDTLANFGRAHDKPVPGDWNGDGRDDLGIYRAGTWYLDTNGNDQLDATDEVLKLGGPNDAPVVGDWDGDGRDEIGIVQNGQVIHGERLTQLLRQN